MSTGGWVRVGRVGAWLIAVGFAVFALVRATGFELGHPFVQLLAFTPYVGFAAVLALGALLGARQWRSAAVLGLAVVVLGACLLPRGFGAPATADGPTLTVM